MLLRQAGCFDAYCSAKVLKAAGGGSLDTFFERLEAGDAACREIFETYTNYLAIEINNLRMAFDCDICWAVMLEGIWRRIRH